MYEYVVVWKLILKLFGTYLEEEETIQGEQFLFETFFKNVTVFHILAQKNSFGDLTPKNGMGNDLCLLEDYP